MLKKSFLLIISVFIYALGFSQQDSLISHTKTPNEDFFFSEDPDFMITEIPEKWKNESAVILCRKFNYSYIKKKNLHDKEHHMVRVKILNKEAVNHFTEFYFPYTVDSHFGIRITKKNGSTHVVEMSTSEVVKAKEVPSYYYSSHYKKYKRVIIPNLEIGDILDYKYVREKKYHLYVDRSTTALEHILTTQYPILKQRYDIEFTSGLVFVGRTFNLNDTLVETEPHHHQDPDIEKTTQDFSFEDLNREKSNPEMWSFPTVDEPSIKMQIRFPTYDPLESKLLVDEEFIINQPYDLSLIQDKEIMKTQIMTYSGDKEAVLRRLKKERESFHSDTDFATEIYYRLRDNYTRGKIQTIDGIDLSGRTYTVDDVYFTNTFSLVLTRLHIPHKLVVAAKRTIPNLDNVVFPHEMSRAIKVEDTYFFPFSNFTTADHIPESLLGAQAMVFDYEYPFKMKEMPPFEKVVLPSKTYKQNLITNEHTIQVSKDFKTLNTTILRTFEGLSKARNTGTAVYEFNYLGSENDLQENTLKEELEPKPIFNTQHNQKESENSEKHLDKKLAYFKKQRQKDYPVTKYTHFELISAGRERDNGNLIYEEQFTVSGLIQPKGKEFEFEIGKLIGKQLELQPNDLNRESNIHLDFANGFHNIYLITLPEGYTISNLQALNFELANSAGGFNCKASMNKNVLRITVNKFFNVQDAEAKDWPEFTNIINMANQFTQTKVVIHIEK